MMKPGKALLVLFFLVMFASCTNKSTMNGVRTLPVVAPFTSPANTAAVSTSTATQRNNTPVIPSSSPYIGLKIPPLPDGIEDYGGGLIEGDGPEYALHLVKTKDAILMIWFVKLLGPYEQVVDVLSMSVLDKNEMINAHYCMIEGIEDPEVITISKFDKAAFRTRFITNDKIRKAWRANRQTEKFEPILALEGIECSAEGGFDPNGLVGQYSGVGY